MYLVRWKFSGKTYNLGAAYIFGADTCTNFLLGAVVMFTYTLFIIHFLLIQIPVSRVSTQNPIGHNPRTLQYNTGPSAEAIAEAIQDRHPTVYDESELKFKVSYILAYFGFS